jgi:hypothetical protein
LFFDQCFTISNLRHTFGLLSCLAQTRPFAVEPPEAARKCRLLAALCFVRVVTAFSSWSKFPTTKDLLLLPHNLL